MVEVNGVIEQQFGRPDATQFKGNYLISIHPYKQGGIWQFDDERIGVRGELFVQDINKMIDDMVKKAGLDRPENGFRAIFSSRPFPNYHMKLNLIPPPKGEEDLGGSNYQMEGSEIEGWLCPVLLCFFEEAPKHIYVRAENL